MGLCKKVRKIFVFAKKKKKRLKYKLQTLGILNLLNWVINFVYIVNKLCNFGPSIVYFIYNVKCKAYIPYMFLILLSILIIA